MTLGVFIPSVTAATLVTATVLCFTPSHSFWRPAAVPFVVWMASSACEALDFFDRNQLVNPMQTGFVIAFALHFIGLMCVVRIDDGDLRREIVRDTGQLAETITVQQRFGWTLYLLSTLRGVGTSYEIKGLSSATGPASRSRSRFILHNVGVVVVQYLFLDFMSSQPMSEADKERLYAPGREYLVWRPKHLPSATLEEVWVHFVIALLCWGPVGRQFLDIQYRIAALLSVSLGVSRPEQWPPMFGSIFETYSLRRFWSRSWQQLFRWCFANVGTFWCDDVLHLPRRSLITRYANTVAVFAASAWLHAGMDLKSGIGLDQTGTLVCFLLQPVGIALEDAVQAIFHRWAGTSGNETWHRLVGYVWVWTFVTLVAPIYNIPLFRYQDPSKAGVPFPVVQPFLLALKG